MTENELQTPAENRAPQSFGWQHLLAILFALGLTVGIFVFVPFDDLERFKELAYFGAFLIMLITSATVILPAPGMVAIPILGALFNPLLIGLAGGLGTALGEFTGYMMGYGASAIVDESAWYERVSGWVGGRYGLAFIALLGFIPNPVFDMAGMVAGSLRIKWWQFFIATFIGKTARTILLAYAGAYSIDWIQQVFS